MSTFEKSNPCDVDIEKLANLLGQDFRNVKPKDLKFTYHGTYNVFEFRKYIVRVLDKDLRNQQGIQLLQNEVVKFKNLAKILSIAIPQPERYSLDESMPYMMYKKLPGEPLSTIFQSLNNEKKKLIALGIAEFLNELHSPRVLHTVHAKVFHTNFTTSEYRLFWETRFEEVKEKLFPLVELPQKAWIYNLFSTFLRKPENFRFKPTITHCDFDTSNILVDPRKGIVTGIVDFEETKAWDPAADLLFYEDHIFQQQILESYHHTNTDSEILHNRMKFLYCRTFAPYITWGLDHENSAMVEYGLKRLEELRKKFPN